jgi:hypothetical protein
MYLYLCGGTPKIIKILVVVPQIIDGVSTTPPPPLKFFPGKAPRQKLNLTNGSLIILDLFYNRILIIFGVPPYKYKYLK